jgi:hypothetical protein
MGGFLKLAFLSSREEWNQEGEWWKAPSHWTTLPRGARSANALAYSRRDASESGPAGGCDMEFAVDLNNGVGCLSEELAWFRVANEALDSRPN